MTVRNATQTAPKPQNRSTCFKSRIGTGALLPLLLLILPAPCVAAIDPTISTGLVYPSASERARLQPSALALFHSTALETLAGLPGIESSSFGLIGAGIASIRAFALGAAIEYWNPALVARGSAAFRIVAGRTVSFAVGAGFGYSTAGTLDARLSLLTEFRLAPKVSIHLLALVQGISPLAHTLDAGVGLSIYEIVFLEATWEWYRTLTSEYNFLLGAGIQYWRLSAAVRTYVSHTLSSVGLDSWSTGGLSAGGAIALIQSNSNRRIRLWLEGLYHYEPSAVTFGLRLSL